MRHGKVEIEQGFAPHRADAHAHRNEATPLIRMQRVERAVCLLRPSFTAVWRHRWGAAATGALRRKRVPGARVAL